MEAEMSLALTTHDHELLLTVGEYRVLTSAQAAILCGRNGPATRRRLGALNELGLVAARHSGLGHGSGRPEKLFSLSAEGVACLKTLGLIDADAETEPLTARRLKHPEHDEVISEVWSQLTLLARHLDGYDVLNLAPPRLRKTASPPAGEPHSARAPSGDASELIPDAVFALRHRGVGKTLLFFLEVDMGTQPLSSTKGSNRDVGSKIVRYQSWFRGGEYQRFSAEGTMFRGFRVLFVAGGTSRLAGLCQLVRQMPPSNFVWVTEDRRMRREGLWARIWLAGGDTSQPPASILGSLAPETPSTPADLAFPRRASATDPVAEDPEVQPAPGCAADTPDHRTA